MSITLTFGKGIVIICLAVFSTLSILIRRIIQKEVFKMWKRNHKSIPTRVISALAASAVAGSQILAALPFNAVAAENTVSKQTDISPDKISWLGDEPAEPNYGDVDGNGSINAVDASLIASYATTGNDNDIDLAAADVDSDGKVTLRDAEIILMYYNFISTGGKNEIKLELLSRSCQL